MYYLKLFDEDLISFNMTNDFGLTISDINIIGKNRNIFPIELIEDVNEKNLIDFLESRIIPKNRTFVQNILEEAGLNINDRKAIIDVSKGLSLIDSYWIVEDRNLKFAEYNLFDNEFSDVLSLVAFTGYTSKRKGLISSPEFTTNGMLPKAWRRIGGKIYLFKGGTDSNFAANTGYEPYCEFYASQVAGKMKINHVSYSLNKWKNMVASTCELFTNKDISYVQIGDVVTYGGIKKVFEYIKKLGFEDKFADMILFDAICINPDRHYGNFGLLRDNHTGKFVDFAPIFDNGESLLAKTMPSEFENRDEFMKYIEKSELNISYYGVSYDELVKEFCKNIEHGKLRRLLDFEFKRDVNYNSYFTAKRLRCLDKMIQKRANHFLQLLNEEI